MIIKNDACMILPKNTDMLKLSPAHAQNNWQEHEPVRYELLLILTPY